MPFVDHVFLKSDPLITAAQDANDPFDLSGALRIDNDGLELSNPRNIAIEHLGAAFFIGETEGLIRTKIHLSDHPLNITNEGQFGIYFMSSQLDLTGASGSAYAFVMHVGATIDWRLVEYTLGVNFGGLVTHLSGSTVGTPALGSSLVMEVDWRLNIAKFGGIRIACRAAAGQNFSALERVYTTTISNPLLVSLSEGLIYADLEGQIASLTRCWFQDTFYSNFSADTIA